jgi:sugar phosphate permease
MSNPYQSPMFAPTAPIHSDEAPTKVRYGVVFVATLAAVMLYLDRVSIGKVLTAIEKDLELESWQSDSMVGAFFLTYALTQVPAGWLSDRFGARRMLTIYVLGWSVCTVLTGLATSFALLLSARLLFGITQAGAFPASSALLSKWAPVSVRGIASSVVALGGRLGGAVAPKLTAIVIGLMAGSLWVTPWRGTLVLYGVCGLFVAGLCLMWLRNRPSEHPQCNAAEQALIDEGRPPISTTKPVALPVVPILASFSLWMMCLAQFTTNVGWAFLINHFPKYLETVKDVSPLESGTMASAPWIAGIVGLFLGGVITDVATRYIGVRWGRCLPMAVTRFLAAGTYLLCLEIESPWGQTAAIAVMAFSTDLGIGATWAFAQDVGGRSAGAVLGWGNMWGNFGAAVQPFLVTWALSLGGIGNNWNAAFYMLTIAFVISGVASLFINAAVPLSSNDE